MVLPRWARKLNPVAAGLTVALAVVYGLDFWIHHAAAYWHLALLLILSLRYVDLGWQFGVSFDRLMRRGQIDYWRRAGHTEEDIQRRLARGDRLESDLYLGLTLIAEIFAFAFTGRYSMLISGAPYWIMWFCLAIGAVMIAVMIFSIIMGLRGKV